MSTLTVRATGTHSTCFIANGPAIDRLGAADAQERTLSPQSQPRTHRQTMVGRYQVTQSAGLGYLPPVRPVSPRVSESTAVAGNT